MATFLPITNISSLAPSALSTTSSTVNVQAPPAPSVTSVRVQAPSATTIPSSGTIQLLQSVATNVPQIQMQQIQSAPSVEGRIIGPAPGPVSNETQYVNQPSTQQGLPQGYVDPGYQPPPQEQAKETGMAKYAVPAAAVAAGLLVLLMRR